MNNENIPKYEEPKMIIIVFETADIIATSDSGFAGEDDSLYDEEEQ